MTLNQKVFGDGQKPLPYRGHTMKKFTKILTVAMACAIAFGAAGCAKSTTYADYINPENPTETPTSEKYVVNVRSAGGLSLDNVKVTMKRADGSTYKTGISKDGKIEFSAALGEYTLEVDETSLPEGYYLDGTVYKTNPDEREEVTIKIPSKVIDQTATGSTSYAVGQIIRDFVFTDCYGQQYKLSETLQKKKAVVLNFWYTGCGPCKSEFPFIQQAYTANPDVEFFGFCSTHQGDTNKAVADYKKSNGLSTLPLGIDNIGLGNNFGVTAYPTTVVIDRYGLIAYRSTGSEPSLGFWNSLFSDFTSDNYTQNPETDDDTGDGTEPEKPDVTMPSSLEIEKAFNGEGVSATYRADPSEYSWPWLVGNDEDGSYIYSSNTGKQDSFSILIATVKMKQGQLLSFDYNVSTEAGMDCLYVIIDNQSMISDGLSGQSGWQTYDLYVADRDKEVEVIFTYIKDPEDPSDDSIGDDVVKLRNLRLSDASDTDKPLDVMRPAASGLEDGAVMYSNYITPVKGDDGFYHVDKKDGPLLYITINQLTPWSDLHMDGSITEDGTNSYYNTLYMMTNYEYSNRAEGDGYNVNIGGKDMTKVVLAYFTVSIYVGTTNSLMPVSEELRSWAESFCIEKAKAQGRPTYDQEWLEFCYYYNHYGPDHAEGEECRVDTDPSKGLSEYNSFVAGVKGITTESNETYDAKTGRNFVDIDYQANQGERGDYYKLTAPKTGVYNIRAFEAENNVQQPTPSAEGEGEGETTGTSTYLFIYKDGKIVNDLNKSDVLDFDVLTTKNKYYGFNYYIALEEGETVYLRLAVYLNTKGSYEFEVNYMGETYETLYNTSTAGGIWTYHEDTGVFYYLAVDVVYDSGTDCYYIKDENGEPDYSEPIYINMIYTSYFSSAFNGTHSNNYSLEMLINTDGAFYGSAKGKMLAYLEQAKAKDPEDTYYGMVKANAEIVTLIKEFLDMYNELGKTEGNDWLAFGVYMEHFGIGL